MVHYSKIHPSEKVENYAVLINRGIMVLQQGLEYLFEQTSIHISIYSTTLFDALRFNVRANYSVWFKQYRDYVSGMLEEHVALKILPEENPTEKYNSGYILPINREKNYYYENFKPEILMEKLL